jgi:hypothetical protein
MELPPVPPPRPDAPGPPDAAIEPRRGSGRWPVLVAAAVVAVVGVIAVVTPLAGRGDGFPDAVLGFERLRGGSAESAEEAMEGIRIGQIEVSAAVYGIGETPRMVAAIYENYPEGVDVEAIIQGAAGGAEVSGGRVNERSLQLSEGAGYRFACMSGGGPGFLVPGGPSERGVLCVFEGEAVGIVISTHTRAPVIGLRGVRAFVEALGSA